MLYKRAHPRLVVCLGTGALTGAFKRPTWDGNFFHALLRVKERKSKVKANLSRKARLMRRATVRLLPPRELARLLAMTDVHLYLTVPFVVSWSLFNAIACEAVVVASDTAPVREIVTHGKNGLLADFFDVDGLANLALDVLRDPAAYRHLGEAGQVLIDERYPFRVTLPQVLRLYEQTCRRD